MSEEGAGVRRRVKPREEAGSPPDSVEEVNSQSSEAVPKKPAVDGSVVNPVAAEEAAALTTNTYWLTRILFIRSLAFIYCEYCYMKHASLHYLKRCLCLLEVVKYLEATSFLLNNQNSRLWALSMGEQGVLD